jgi:transcriptional antiterminator NusG
MNSFIDNNNNDLLHVHSYDIHKEVNESDVFKSFSDTKGEPVSETTLDSEPLASENSDEESMLSMKFYVIFVPPGYEDKVALEMKNQDVPFVGRVMVPKSFHEVVRRGKTVVSEHKLYPGYVFAELHLSDISWSYVHNALNEAEVPGNRNFKPPLPLTEKEVAEILKQVKNQALKKLEDYRPRFLVGDRVIILEDAFASMEGIITSIDEEKERLHIEMSIFSRKIPLVIGFSGVKLIENYVQ